MWAQGTIVFRKEWHQSHNGEILEYRCHPERSGCFAPRSGRVVEGPYMHHGSRGDSRPRLSRRAKLASPTGIELGNPRSSAPLDSRGRLSPRGLWRHRGPSTSQDRSQASAPAALRMTTIIFLGLSGSRGQHWRPSRPSNLRQGAFPSRTGTNSESGCDNVTSPAAVA
jgi:hypothetical protein